MLKVGKVVIGRLVLDLDICTLEQGSLPVIGMEAFMGEVVGLRLFEFDLQAEDGG